MNGFETGKKRATGWCYVLLDEEILQDDKNVSVYRSE
jgi:hypothetical protein